MPKLTKLQRAINTDLAILVGSQINEDIEQAKRFTGKVSEKWLAFASLVRSGVKNRNQLEVALNRILLTGEEEALKEITSKVIPSYNDAFDILDRHLSPGTSVTESVQEAKKKSKGLKEPEAKKLKVRKKKPQKGRSKSSKRRKTPSTKEVESIVNRKEVTKRIRKWTKNTKDKKVVSKVLDMLEEGKDADTILNQVKPDIEAFSGRLRTVIRTESARIDNEMREKVFEQFEDSIYAFQIQNPLDERTRPEHAKRAGRIYYKDAGKGKYKASDRPQLPDKPNCRCWYVPLVTGKMPEQLEEGPRVSTAQYQGWFNKQSLATKKKIVGKERFEAMQRKLAKSGKKPSYFDFINDEGELRPVNSIKKESSASVLRRRARQKKKALKAKKDAAKAKRSN